MGCNESLQRTALFWASAVMLLIATVVPARAGSWDTERIKKEDIIRLRTVCPGEGEYWFPVWVVVIDRFAYVRLGTRAAARVECNTTPALAVEVSGQRYDNVRGLQVPEMADQVAAEMAKKYTSDLIIRWMSHPMTLRLEP